MHRCPWEELSALQWNKRKITNILMPANRPWEQLPSVQSKKWEDPDILIPAQLSPRKIISSSFDATKYSWYLDVCTVVSGNNYQLFNRNDETSWYLDAEIIASRILFFSVMKYRVYRFQSWCLSEYNHPISWFNVQLISNLKYPFC